ncbi:hypothetical protein NHX12_028095 [Muraenolepis orangiensis]|uniref:Ig-like domain-containing protein n=1 Tax=Muraenolepis orangiensis TaxID=630683 RepID=A0A9Q0EDF6_9TELE|nr:hypothetical protein NHX12_028095 [Muraenolepis orangiensis]
MSSRLSTDSPAQRHKEPGPYGDPWLPVPPGLCRGLLLTSGGPQTVRRAEGEAVTLGCTYAWGPSDSGDLDIEWSLVSPDATVKDQMLLSYSHGMKYFHGVTDGGDFSTADPSQGDASLSIPVLSPAHAATYQCKVKKSPGVDMRKVTLVVMEKPSVPKCWIEGPDTVGEALSMHCQSSAGSAPLRYAWSRGRGGPLPTALTQTGGSGPLVIGNLSLGLAGSYLCTVSNDVGEGSCRVHLVANKPPSRAGVVVGTVEKDFSNDIREDALAPVSRPGSRSTNRSSSRAPGGRFSQVSRPEALFTEDMLHIPPSQTTSRTPRHTPDRYDSEDGYVV